MALETALASPATKERLLNGPLSVPIENFCQWVLGQQFSTGTDPGGIWRCTNASLDRV